jgi:Mn-dependent DtxR family transcriptional regulator
MAKKAITLKLYDDIRKEHDRLVSITEFGTQKYTDSWIRNTLAERFYKSVATIEDIIFYRV